MATQQQKNIFIVGTSCTGKTTLLKALRDFYHAQCQQPNSQIAEPAVICEVARTVLKQLGYDRQDIATSPERSLMIQRAILDAQHKAETSLTEDPASWYISDRSGIDPIFYTRMFVGEDEAEQLLSSPAWKTLEQNMKSGTVLLCEAGCNWLVDDGTRLMPQNGDDWIRFDLAFRKLLQETNIGFTVISKDMVDIADRVNLAIDVHRMNEHLNVDRVMATNSGESSYENTKSRDFVAKERSDQNIAQ